MSTALRFVTGASLLSVSFSFSLGAQSKPTIEQFMSPASPLDLVAAKKADRLAWMAYDRGMRNVYTAAAPDFRAVRLTRFLEDNGVDVSDVTISDDGGVIVFVRGSAPNREGWVANPSHDPNGPAREIWAVRTTPGSTAFRIAEGSAPELSRPGLPGAASHRHGQGRKAFHHRLGREQQPALVSRWQQDRVRLEPRESLVHRDVRRRHAERDIHLAQRRF
jgi:hypothetical protein